MGNELAIVLAAAIGVVGALAGAFVGPYFQRSHEKWKADREDQQALREKAAELFDELDRIVSESHSALIATMGRIFDSNTAPSPLPDLGRLRLLVGVYFPEARSLIDEYERQVESLSSETAKMLEDILKKNDDPDGIKVLTALIVQRRSAQSQKFVRDVRTKVANSIPRLK